MLSSSTLTVHDHPSAPIHIHQVHGLLTLLFSLKLPAFQSMFHAHRGSRSTANALVRLWKHEAARVFRDRIVDTSSREWFDAAVSKVCLPTLSHPPDLPSTPGSAQPHLHGSYVRS